MTTTDSLVDVNIPRFSQAVVALTTGLAFITDLRWLVAAMFAVLAVSVLGGPRTAPLTQIYVRVVRPLVVKGATAVEPAAPPRFAQTLGTAFLGFAVVAFGVGWTTIGWILTLIVTSLAALAAATTICVGCIIHERIAR